MFGAMVATTVGTFFVFDMLYPRDKVIEEKQAVSPESVFSESPSPALTISGATQETLAADASLEAVVRLAARTAALRVAQDVANQTASDVVEAELY